MHREEFSQLKEWCGEHRRAPSCFHGSVGNGLEVVEKYVETQDLHHAKSLYMPRTLSDYNDGCFMPGYGGKDPEEPFFSNAKNRRSSRKYSPKKD